MHLQPFEMSNLNDGFGQEQNNQDMDDMSPLCWRTGEERSNQHPNVERLSFPLGNDEPALEYANSLNALNAAFGCYPLSSSGGNAPPAAPTDFDGSSDITSIASSNAAFASSDGRQSGASNAADFLWQQQLQLPQQPHQQQQQLAAGQTSNLEPTLGLPTEKVTVCETHDSQGHVQGMFGSKKAKTLLPIDYKPSSNSVILGRGRCSESIGNRRFKLVVQRHLQEYLDAPGKLEKTFIVTKVLNIIEQSCPVGAFVKFENGRWWSAGERASREKIGASFRDALHSFYKSSSKSKVAKRKAKAQAEKKQPPKGELSELPEESLSDSKASG